MFNMDLLGIVDTKSSESKAIGTSDGLSAESCEGDKAEYVETAEGEILRYVSSKVILGLLNLDK